MLPKEYIMGFVEGEGCFSISVSRRYDTKVKFGVKPVFTIVLAKRDILILREIRDSLGVGKIYIRRTPPKHVCIQLQYAVYSFHDLIIVQEFFSKMKFRTSKKKDFEVWSKALDMVKRKEHITKEGILKICRMRDSVNKLQGQTKKRTAEQVKKMIEEDERKR